jgi:DNA polymerase-3 subunit gamma/tau
MRSVQTSLRRLRSRTLRSSAWRCADSGRDASSFASDLESRARELLLVHTLGEIPAELALTPESDARLLAQAERVSRTTVVRLLERIGSALESVRAGADARTSLELALVQAASPEVDASTRALLARIERLEAGNGACAPPASPTPATPVQAPAPSPPVTSPLAVQAPSPPAPVTSAPPVVPAPPVTPAPAAQSQDEPVREEPAPAAVAAVGDPLPEGIESPDAVAPVVEPLEDLQAVLELWPAVVELVGAGHALCGAVIADTRPVELAGEDLTVGFPTSAAFLKKKAEDPANRQIVTEALRQLAGGRWRISYELREDLDGAAGGDAATRAYTEEEWIERFKSELAAEEIPPEPESEPEPGEPVVTGEGRA